MLRAELISGAEAGCGTEREEAGESPGPGTSVSPPGGAGLAGGAAPAGSAESPGTAGRISSGSGGGWSSLSGTWLREILTGSRTHNLNSN